MGEIVGPDKENKESLKLKRIQDIEVRDGEKNNEIQLF